MPRVRELRRREVIHCVAYACCSMCLQLPRDGFNAVSRLRYFSFVCDCFNPCSSARFLISSFSRGMAVLGRKMVCTREAPARRDARPAVRATAYARLPTRGIFALYYRLLLPFPVSRSVATLLSLEWRAVFQKRHNFSPRPSEGLRGCFGLQGQQQELHTWGDLRGLKSQCGEGAFKAAERSQEPGEEERCERNDPVRSVGHRAGGPKVNDNPDR